MSAAAASTSREPRSETVFHLQQAFKLALSMVLFYLLALWTNWDDPKYGGLAIVIISLGTSGASIEKGLMRVVGTTFGLAFGFLILGLFIYDRWAMLLAFAVYLTATCYFMQASRYPYAWYAAAFIPLVVWADNYPNFESVFYFGTFRYLNTAAGVIIYTMVDLLFWPRRAGDQLDNLGRGLWTDVREQFRSYSARLIQGKTLEGISDQRAKLAGTLSRTLAALQQAYLDTPEVSNQRRVWEAWRLNIQGFVDAMEVWSETIDDCRELDLNRLVPGLASGLNTLDERLERVGVLWESRPAGVETSKNDDAPLRQELSISMDLSAVSGLSVFQRAALMGLLGQLEILDRASRELMTTMRVIAGLDPSRAVRVSSLSREGFRPSRWDPGRLISALYPAAVLVAAFFFWVFVNPPTGPKVPMFAGILAIMILLARINPVASWFAMLLALVFAVAPIYWLVMPALSTGFALLSLIFIYSFVFGYLGGRSPALKSGPIIMFVVATGISNQQSYSFQGLVDAAMMILLAGAILTAVYYLFNPLRPEQRLLRILRRFFHGCGQVMQGCALVGSAQRTSGRRLRKRCLESIILPAPGEMQKAAQHLDYKLYPENSPEKVQRLHDSLQSISDRLQSLEIAYERIARRYSDLPDSVTLIGKPLYEATQRVFERWKCLRPGDAVEEERSALQQLSTDVQQHFRNLGDAPQPDRISDRLLADLYTMLGNVRGLINAMNSAQRAINQINWQCWATTRF